MRTNNADVTGPRYRHKRTGRLYRVVGYAYIEATRKEAVVYADVATGLWWIRPATEFFDGRFENVPLQSVEGK